MKPVLRNIRTGAAASIVCLLGSHVALAEPPREVGVESVSRTIDISGIDLTSKAGAQRLYRQILSTAGDICLHETGTYQGLNRARHVREQSQRCFDGAVEGALAQVADRTGVDLVRVAEADRGDFARFFAGR